MNEFEVLLIACQRLENSLKKVVLGAVSSSPTETLERDIDKWNHIISQKLRDLKILNSRAILLNASLLKDQIVVPEELSIDEAEIRLNNTTAGHNRWNYALKMKALSRTIQSANDDKTVALDELLTRLGDLDFALKVLNSKEESKIQELYEIKNKWSDTAQQWVVKKKDPENKAKTKETIHTVNKDLSNRLSRLLSKMETMKALQGRLLGSCPTYDWLRDSEKVEKYHASARKPPYKFSDFL